MHSEKNKNQNLSARCGLVSYVLLRSLWGVWPWCESAGVVFRCGVLELQEWTDEPTEELILSALPETCHQAKEKENYSTNVGFHTNNLSSDQDCRWLKYSGVQESKAAFPLHTAYDNWWTRQFTTRQLHCLQHTGCDVFQCIPIRSVCVRWELLMHF